MRKKIWSMFFVIILIVVIAGVIDWPRGINISYIKDLKVHQGLDLVGGAHLVYEADMSKIDEKERGNALESAKAVIERRVNAFGLSEPSIQAQSGFNNYRIIVELPGISNIDEAVKIIGTTAQLEFREGIAGKSLDESGAFKTPDSYDINNWQDVGLSGAKLKKAQAQINQSTYEPDVSITFNDEGAKIFAEVTGRNVGKPIAIFIDQQLLSAPKVNQAIEGGNAIITGQFTMQEAKNLAIQLNAGALPTPIKLVEQKNIGATLGRDSVHKSFIAGLIGILFVILFMIFRYRFPGFIAGMALFIYALITLALFKVFAITMTLAGIAGFILSVGMAVDANILIFERMREELRRGKAYTSAIKEGFRRAWSSIFDSNVSSLITCLILFLLGSGTVKGFAVTLAIGIIVSMFSAITITRNLLFLFLGRKSKKV